MKLLDMVEERLENIKDKELQNRAIDEIKSIRDQETKCIELLTKIYPSIKQEPIRNYEDIRVNDINASNLSFINSLHKIAKKYSLLKEKANSLNVEIDHHISKEEASLLCNKRSLIDEIEDILLLSEGLHGKNQITDSHFHIIKKNINDLKKKINCLESNKFNLKNNSPLRETLNDYIGKYRINIKYELSTNNTSSDLIEHMRKFDQLVNDFYSIKGEVFKSCTHDIPSLTDRSITLDYSTEPFSLESNETKKAQSLLAM